MQRGNPDGTSLLPTLPFIPHCFGSVQRFGLVRIRRTIAAGLADEIEGIRGPLVLFPVINT